MRITIRGVPEHADETEGLISHRRRSTRETTGAAASKAPQDSLFQLSVKNVQYCTIVSDLL